MIVADTSAVIEIIVDGPLAEVCMDRLEVEDVVAISAGSMLECLIVASGKSAEKPLSELFEFFGFRIEPVTEARARAAADAYRCYGKGWHAASLNFGDCFAYALAKELQCPLLFVGKDFSLTDIVSAVDGSTTR